MKSRQQDVPGPCTTGFCIVGIGASAGGLEAFTELLQHLPLDTGLGFVLVQHLDPQHESALTQLLTRATSMPVREVTHNLRVQANHVFVIPPNTCMFIERGFLKLRSRDKTPGAHHSIDFFFESLAQDQRERAIGVILSGTATDGTLGLEAIKAEGGITFAQDDSGQYDSMPRSAVAAGCVDLVLSPANIAKELARIAKHPYVAGKAAEALTPEKPGRAVPSGPRGAAQGYKKILLLLRNHCGVDFSLYKSTTIQRRITRRMVLNKQNSLESYAGLLRGNSKELAALYADVLISVTSFYRNPEAFDVLKRKVFSKLLHQRSGDPFRVWVLGCSTGQEAYSIAMAFTEAAEKVHRVRKLQVFATDLNDALLEKARSGLYAKSLAQDVTPERLLRFFVEEEGGYRVIKAMRELVVFARQNIISDPPFSHMDLISCRNLLIYFEPGLQKKAFPTFHYALKPEGFLFLGASESVGGFTELFEPVDRKNKIYSRKAAPVPALLLPMKKERSERPPAALPLKASKAEVPEGLRGELSAQREADRVLVNRFAPRGVLINAELQILQFRGSTSAYLEPPTGKASFDVLKMAREGLMLPLRAAISKAKKENKIARKENVAVKQNGKTRTVNVEVIPLKNLRERCFLIVFEDAGEGYAVPSAPPREQPAARPASKREESRRVAELERDLAETRDYLQAIQEQHEAANEELQASNEEVQSANEELQSLNEELETSKEELESANEELTTINEEMANRNTELNRLNADLTNLQSSTKLAVVLLGRDLTIRRFSPQAEKQFDLKATDVGRPFDTIRHNLDVPDMQSFINEVITSVRESVRVVFDKRGRWFSLLVRPYVTHDNKVDGAVLVLLDIDALKRSEQAIAAARDYADAVVRTVPNPLLILDADLRVHTANEAFYRTFKVSPAESEGCLIYEVGNRQWNIPRLRELLGEILSRNNSFDDFEVTHKFEGIGPRTVLLNARKLDAVESQPARILLGIHDISERKRMEAELQAWQRELEARVAVQKAQLLADVDERKRLEAEIAGAVEGEQLRLGQELHDGLAQELTGIGMMLDALEMRLRKPSPANAREAGRLHRMLAKARDNARALAKGFYPVELEKHGLLVALQELARRNQERFRVACVVEADENAPARLKDAKAIQLFRIAQEAVHNAAKHAQAKHILIRLATQDGEWVLTVKDDGVGLRRDPRQAEGMGLRIMQHRAHMLGGRLEVRNDDGGGVIVSCAAPAGPAAAKRTGKARG